MSGDLLLFESGFVPASRTWRGNMCGSHVSGLPPVSGGSADASLVLSWFYPRYDAASRARIRSQWHAESQTHVLLSWPDDRGFGLNPATAGALYAELVTDGFSPAVMLSSKDYDPRDVPGILAHIAPILPYLVDVVPVVCIGWELSLWLTPTQVQQLIDALAPRFVAYGARVYVHFQQGYGSFQQPGETFAAFWNRQVGKLTGLLHQNVLSQTPDEYRTASGGLEDILTRFAGNYGVVTDSGFGHPFDCVALEITAQPQFNGQMREADGNALGTWAIQTPAQHGPAGLVGVMGSGNGQR